VGRDALADGEKLPKPRSIEALVPIPQWRRRLQRAPFSRSYRSSSMRAGRPAKANLSLDAGRERAVLQHTRWHQFFECFDNLTHGRYDGFCRHNITNFQVALVIFGDHQIGAMR
jgi:hypothetical protein